MVRRMVFRHRSALLGLIGTGIAAWALAAPPVGAVEVAGSLLLALAGSHLRLVSIRVLGKSARVHHAGGRVLHVVGPYARIRNPLYVANALITAGLALMAAGPLAMTAALVAIALTYDLAVRQEEDALEAAFGHEYREYRRQVPRWVPRLRGPTPADDAPTPVPWGEVLARERPLVLGVPLAVVATFVVRAGHVPLVAAWEELARRLGAPPFALLLLVGGFVCLANASRTERKLRRKEALRAASVGPALRVKDLQDLETAAR